MRPDKYAFASPFDSAEKGAEALAQGSSSKWVKRGERAALRLFSSASVRVPAYKDFLKKNHIRPASIKKIEDFAHLPTLDKGNYLRAYPREALSWDGSLMQSYHTYASTSGSTGTPIYFPRSDRQVDQYAFLAELYLRTQFKIHERSTLYLNCFAMGSWIGGLFTFEAIERLARRGQYKLHQITPGLAKDEALKAMKELAPAYDQVIIGGYPPFVKDLIDEGRNLGVQWQDHKIGFVFSAESFSEGFRDHIFEAAGQNNPLTNSLNHYGTVDMGTMAYEGPLAAYMRRQALGNNKFFSALFTAANRLPTLAQYLPEHFFFEEASGALLCTADAGFPLIRYELKDQGGIIAFDDAWAQLRKHNPTLDPDLRKAGITESIFKLPFVYLYERADFTVVLYGANIYPQHIRKALERAAFKKQLSGKCTLKIVETRSREPRLHVHVEMRPGVVGTPGLSASIAEAIIQTLIRDNSEFRSNWSHLPKKMRPVIKLWTYGDNRYFGGKGKQKWTHS